jgi:CelD/BcsL family acetyltransferase involved in cellulose biosynthesis
LADGLADEKISVDEIGYLFTPSQWGYSAENYWASFAGKSRKRIRREIDALTGLGLEIRRGAIDDVETLLELNQAAFGERSYFADERFRRGFVDLVEWLAGQDALGVTTVLIDGTVAAVDVNAVYRNACTVLAGGTHADFPGVAKLINSIHIDWACRQKYDEVDFLCGDFGWKQRFHLTPRPLYQYGSPPPSVGGGAFEETSSMHAQ